MSIRPRFVNLRGTVASAVQRMQLHATDATNAAEQPIPVPSAGLCPRALDSAVDERQCVS